MALTITETFRMTAAGKAWRCFTVVHDSSTVSLTATSLDLALINAVVGTGNAVMSFVALASNFADINRISVAADRESIVWGSSMVCTQNITVIGEAN